MFVLTLTRIASSEKQHIDSFARDHNTMRLALLLVAVVAVVGAECIDTCSTSHMTECCTQNKSPCYFGNEMICLTEHDCTRIQGSSPCAACDYFQQLPYDDLRTCCDDDRIERCDQHPCYFGTRFKCLTEIECDAQGGEPAMRTCNGFNRV